MFSRMATMPILRRVSSASLRPLATSEKTRSGRMPCSVKRWSWVSRFLDSSSALLTRAYP